MLIEMSMFVCHIKPRTCPESDSSWEISPFELSPKLCFPQTLEQLSWHYIHVLISYCDNVMYDNV